MINLSFYPKRSLGWQLWREILEAHVSGIDGSFDDDGIIAALDKALQLARQEGIEQAAKVAEQSCRASDESAREIAAEIRALNEGKG